MVQNQQLLFSQNDQGNAQMLMADWGPEVRFCLEAGEWLIWEDGRWRVGEEWRVRNMFRESVRARLRRVPEELTDGEMIKGATKWLKGCLNVPAIARALQASQDLPQLAVRESDLDADLWRAGAIQGELDLMTGQVQAPNPRSLLTHRLGSPSEARAQCPRWRQFVAEIFQNDRELIQFVQAAVGYCLTGSNREQVMFVCIGEGANGKSTFLGTLYRLFGDYAMSTPFATFDARSRNEQTNDLARLKGKRFVTIAETDEDSFLAEQKIKQATGDDPITCRFLRKEFFEYIPQFKIWMAVNRMPGIKGVDYGIRRRLMVIPFGAKFDGSRRDDSLKDKLVAELPGILNWALEGLETWKELGLRQIVPAAMTEAIENYKEETDVMGQWVEESLEMCGESEGEPASSLFDSYKVWAQRHNFRPKNATNWGRDMATKGIGIKRKERNHMVYYGVRLRPEAQVGV